MTIVCLGTSHREAPTHVLDQLGAHVARWHEAQLHPSDAPAAPPAPCVRGVPGARGASAVPEARRVPHVVLSTCHRVEVYLDLPEGPEPTVAQLLHRIGLHLPEALLPAVRVHAGTAAVEHAVAVAAGVLSVAVGEREIAGQVQRARAAARADGTLGPRLDRLFHHVARAQRAVRRTLTRHQTGSLAERALLEVDVRGRDVLVVGTGDYAGRVVAAARAHRPGRVRVHSATGRAAQFTAHEPGTEPWHGSLAEALTVSDVVVCCSGRGVQVHTAMVRAALPARAAGDPLTLVDLARPGDVADDVQGLTTSALRLVTLGTLARARAVAAPPGRTFDELRLQAEEFVAHERVVASGPRIAAMRAAELARAQASWATLLEHERALHGADAEERLRRALRVQARTALHRRTVRWREQAHLGR